MRFSLLTALVAALFLVAAAPQPAGVTPIQQLFLLKEAKPDLERIGIVWEKGIANRDDIFKDVNRASAAAGVKVFLQEADGVSGVGGALRDLIRGENVQAIWIVQEDDLVSKAATQKFIIKEAAKAGVPVLGPSKAWADAGAAIALADEGGLKIYVNKPAATALALSVPEKYVEQTEFLAAN